MVCFGINVLKDCETLANQPQKDPTKMQTSTQEGQVETTNKQEMNSKENPVHQECPREEKEEEGIGRLLEDTRETTPPLSKQWKWKRKRIYP